MTLNSIPSVGMSVLWGWFKRKQVGLHFADKTTKLLNTMLLWLQLSRVSKLK